MAVAASEEEGAGDETEPDEKDTGAGPGSKKRKSKSGESSLTSSSSMKKGKLDDAQKGEKRKSALSEWRSSVSADKDLRDAYMKDMSSAKFAMKQLIESSLDTSKSPVCGADGRLCTITNIYVFGLCFHP